MTHVTFSLKIIFYWYLTYIITVSGLVKLRYFVKVVASYALAKKGIDELLVIKINDVEFRDSRDAPQNCFSRFSRIHVIS